MKEQLVTFETAKLAKEKGFSFGLENQIDDPDVDSPYEDQSYDEGWSVYCRHRKRMDDWIAVSLFHLELNHNGVQYDWKEYYDAPRQSALQKWLREKHNIYVIPEPTTIPRMNGNFLIGFHCIIFQFEDKKLSKRTTSTQVLGDNYKHALELGLKRALTFIK